MQRCANCGFEGGPADGPQHPYMRSSPGCWAAFGELQARAAASFGLLPVHGLVVDCFAASHGGPGEARRDRQSVAMHLVALCAALEHGVGSAGRIALLQRLTTPKRDWPKLDRPPGVPALHHGHLSGARSKGEYEDAARQWAEAVWAFWAPRHDRVGDLLRQAP